MYAAPFTIERGRAALAAILSAFETPPHQGKSLMILVIDIYIDKKDVHESQARFKCDLEPLYDYTPPLVIKT